MMLLGSSTRQAPLHDDLPFNEPDPREPYDEWFRGKIKQKKSKISAQLLREERRRAPRFKLKDLGYMFHHLPVELFCEILGYLHPIDLIRIARTTKYLRSILMSYSFTWIWVLTFVRNPTIPPCPEDMPYPKWTDLLFGSLICQVCGADASIDFVTRRRLCRNCSHDHMLRHRPKLDGTVKLLIFSQHSAAQCTQDRTLLHEIVQELADKLQSYRLGTMSRYHETWSKCKTELESLVVHPMSKDRVASIDKCAKICEAWQKDIIQRSELDDRATQQLVIGMVRRRVVQLGYHVADLEEVLSKPWLIDCFLKDIGVNRTNPLRSIRRDWTKIQPKLEVTVGVMAKNRLAKERKDLISSRQRLIASLYNNAIGDVAQVIPIKRPRPSDVLLLRPFVELANLPSEVTLSTEELSRAIHLFIEKWPPNLGELATILPSGSVPSLDPSWERCGIYSASSVFSCVACADRLGPGRSPGSCLVGWDEAMRHTICARLRPYEPFEINERGCTAARSVLACLDLPLNTLPRVLDELRSELTCSICRHKPIFSWWDCIAHFIDTSHPRAHDKPSWKVILREGRLKDGAVWRGLLGVEK